MTGVGETKIVHRLLHDEVPNNLQTLFTRIADKYVWELRNAKIDLNFPPSNASFRGPNFGPNWVLKPKMISRFFAFFEKAVT